MFVHLRQRAIAEERAEEVWEEAIVGGKIGLEQEEGPWCHQACMGRGGR